MGPDAADFASLLQVQDIHLLYAPRSISTAGGPVVFVVGFRDESVSVVCFPGSGYDAERRHMFWESLLVVILPGTHTHTHTHMSALELGPRRPRRHGQMQRSVCAVDRKDLDRVLHSTGRGQPLSTGSRPKPIKPGAVQRARRLDGSQPALKPTPPHILILMQLASSCL